MVNHHQSQFFLIKNLLKRRETLKELIPVGQNGTYEQLISLSIQEGSNLTKKICLLTRSSIDLTPLQYEATSSLDTRTEHLIQKNMEEVSGEATTIIIAHRLSTIIHADLIIVLENGSIVEKGIHQELLESDGLYSQLWNKQSHEQQK